MKSNIKPVYKNIRYRMVDDFMSTYTTEKSVFLKPGFSPETLLKKIYDQESWHSRNVGRVEVTRIYKPTNPDIKQNMEGFLYFPLYEYNAKTHTLPSKPTSESEIFITLGIVNYAFEQTE